MSKLDPADIAPYLQDFRTDHRAPGKCAFVMMRFERTPAHKKILAAVRTWCEKQGITALRADDKRYADDLWPNVRTYMHGCGFGIAIFDRLTREDFNPNVSLEVGYMLALGKPVCLLKDSNLTALQSDLVGRLYDNFNVQRLNTIAPSLNRWMKDKATQLGQSAISSDTAFSRYIGVRGLRWSNVSTPDGQALFAIASPLGFNLLDGEDIVYLGLFQQETGKEVAFRLFHLLKNVARMKAIFETVNSKTMPPEEVARVRRYFMITKAEVLVSKEVDREKVNAKVKELTTGLDTIPYTIYTEQDIKDFVAKAYEAFGEI